MVLTYAVADLHGRYDLLEAALAAIEADAARRAPERRSIVFLGDYIDRGPHSRMILDRLMAGPPPGWRWICLKGNHEAMMAGAIRGTLDAGDWLSNGGDACLRNFALHRRPIQPFQIPGEYLLWIEALPPIFVDRRRVYVHAGVRSNRPLDRQSERDLLWMRDASPDGFEDFHVVHGHTAHRDGPRLFAGRTNLDTMAWASGRLVIGVFDDDRPGGAVDFIELRR